MVLAKILEIYMFKAGDKVKCIDGKKELVGKTGIVVGYLRKGFLKDVAVQFDNDLPQMCFEENLKLVEKKE